jgi:peptidoglycan/xylan/chitin deacetylase (PgdA/CDA1 family)
LLFFGVCFLPPPVFQKSFGTGQIILPPPPQNGFSSTKVIVLAFDDSSKTEFNLAKPILDKYGYKGIFLQYVLM